jgi:hypothetical protein
MATPWNWSITEHGKTASHTQHTVRFVVKQRTTDRAAKPWCA